ncbi:MAG TPA: PKD domain-containing protein, partial [Chitinophagaceae bacterium]|nr:PKD domain-containing protein [Chitinophagaceae bacterium]
VDFTVTASDQDGDALTYNWDFGEGTKKQGAATESFTYAEGKIYTAKVTVSDGTANVIASASVNTTVTSITVDAAVKFQTMEGFGGFGAKDVYWSSGPFTSPEFVSTLLDDLGLTILRDNIPENFEYTNDNSDPYVTDLTKFNISNNTQGVDGNLSNHLEYLKAMHDAGLQKLIVSIWSAPAWMKTNNMTSNGTQQNSAPPYNPNATSADNQLRTDMYEEFAEMCVAYIKIIKQETGIDVYALSIQNEPRFSQFYASCVYNGEALRDVLKVVGKRFKDEGITTKLFLPEDIGYLDGVSGMIQPTLNDADARQYADIVAVHGYALDGVTANSPDAITWQTMYSWGAAYGIPLWMTETSGFSNDMKGAMDIAKAMYTAINFGNISAWLHWELSQQTLDEYSLMSSSGQKSKRYYASKNFYRYVRPGDYRIQASADASANIYPLAFKNDTAATNTIVLINDNAADRAIKLSGAALPAQFEMFVTSATDDCKSYSTVNSSDNILLPANSVITLYHKN